MAFFAPQFQIISDLHLETPLADPQYTTFKLRIKADNVRLLGDIGLVTNPKLFEWLRQLLQDNGSSRIFYVMGKNEPYRSTYEDAVVALRRFEHEAKNDSEAVLSFSAVTGTTSTTSRSWAAHSGHTSTQPTPQK